MISINAATNACPAVTLMLGRSYTSVLFFWSFFFLFRFSNDIASQASLMNLLGLGANKEPKITVPPLTRAFHSFTIMVIAYLSNAVVMNLLLCDCLIGLNSMTDLRGI